MLTEVLRFFAIICVALIVGKLVSKVRLPAILGWLITGIVFGPYLAQIVTLEITEQIWFKVVSKVFECFAGVMIGREIIFKKIARSGKQIIGITFIQSIAAVRGGGTVHRFLRVRGVQAQLFAFGNGVQRNGGKSAGRGKDGKNYGALRADTQYFSRHSHSQSGYASRLPPDCGRGRVYGHI